MAHQTPRVKALVGIPGSGKSTLSQALIAQDPTWARVNRDDIRQMLMGLPMLPGKLEGTLTTICNEMIVTLLASGRNLIVDNTHCKVSYLNELIALVRPYADIEFQLIDIDPNEAINRDALRSRPVGKKVILQMHENLSQWKDSFDFTQVIPKQSVRPMPQFDRNSAPERAIIVDIDGTLAHMVNRGPFDWKHVGQDEPVRQVIETINALEAYGTTVIVVSGRDGSCESETRDWLHANCVHFDMLFMRQAGDFRKDSLIKREIFDRHIKGKFNVMAVFDDREQVVKMWSDLGFYVFNCNQGGIKF